MFQVILRPLLRTHEEGDGGIAMIYIKGGSKNRLDIILFS